MNIQRLITRLFLFALMISGCRKNGELEESLSYSQVTVQWIYNPWSGKPFRVEIGEQKITDSLIFRNVTYNNALSMVTVSGETKQLKVYDGGTGEKLLDTAVFIKGYQTIKLMALGLTDKPFIPGEGGGAGGEPDPVSRDQAKYRFYYSDETLPASVKMIFYAVDMRASEPLVDTEPQDSITVKKGVLSTYITINQLLRGASTTRYAFRLLNAQTGASIQEMNIVPSNTQSKGYSHPMFNNTIVTSDGLPASKFLTLILRLGAPTESNTYKNKYVHTAVMQTSW